MTSFATELAKPALQTYERTDNLPRLIYKDYTALQYYVRRM